MANRSKGQPEGSAPLVSLGFLTPPSYMKAFLSFDALISVLAIVLIVVYTINAHAYLTKKASSHIEQQVLFDKLVSIADYVVNNAGAKKQIKDFDSIVYPNWIVEEELSRIDQGALARQMKLGKLSIGFEEEIKAEGKNCIFRIVVYGEYKEIKKLYICGE